MDRSSLLQRFYISFMTIVLFFVSQFVEKSKAQDNFQPIKIDGPVTADQIDWYSDSQSVVYLESGNGQMVSTDKIWRTYNLGSQAITSSNTWPFYPQLSTNELTAFQPANSEGTSVVYASPDNGFIVYAGSETVLDETTSYSLQVGSRTTLKYVALQARIYLPYEGRRQFDVLWNKNSTAFAASRNIGGADVGQPAGVVYVSRVTTDLSQLSEMSLDNLQIGSQNYFPFKIYGFSPDGRFLLVEALQKRIASSTHFLLLYDTNEPTSSKVLYTTTADHLITASFDPSGLVLILADNGISRIDINTQMVLSLTQSVDSNTARNARFSPDGNWLAFASPDLDFYLLNLNPTTPTATFTYTASATSTPTATLSPSATNTATSTFTLTSTATYTPSTTPTPTVTFTYTASATSTPTPTLSPSATNTATSTTTPTSTFTPTPGPSNIWPNTAIGALSLNVPDTQKAIVASGSAVLRVVGGGSVVDNSIDAADALDTSSTARVVVDQNNGSGGIYVVGGQNASAPANSVVTYTNQTESTIAKSGASKIGQTNSDPFAPGGSLAIPVPTPSNCKDISTMPGWNGHYTAPANDNLPPGCYSANGQNIAVSNTMLTLGTYIKDANGVCSGYGVYYFQNVKGVQFSGSASLVSVCNFIYLDKTSGSFQVSSTDAQDLEAPTSGPYKGIAYYQAEPCLPLPANFKGQYAFTLSGGANLKVYGTVYVPHDKCNLSGSSGLNDIRGQFICDNISLSGSSTLKVTWDPSQVWNPSARRRSRRHCKRR